MRLGTDSSRVKLNKIDIFALFRLLRALHLQELKEHCETRSKSYRRGIRSGMQALEAGRHSKWRLEVRGRAFEGAGVDGAFEVREEEAGVRSAG